MADRVVSFTSDDMNRSEPSLIPDEIFEYRSLTKADLINKIVEAREELAILKNNPVDIVDVKFAAAKKGEHSLAAELYALRQIIKDAKLMVPVKTEAPKAEVVPGKEITKKKKKV